MDVVDARSESRRGDYNRNICREQKRYIIAAVVKETNRPLDLFLVHQHDKDTDLSLDSAPKMHCVSLRVAPPSALASFGRLEGGRPGFHLGARLAWFWRHPDASVLLLYALLAILLTYPLVLNFSRAVPGHGADDPYLAWNIWWVKYALLDLQRSPLLSDYIFYPIGINLGTYTLTLLNGLLSIPLQLAWEVLPADNLIVLASITLAAFGTYLVSLDLLGRETRGARWGAMIAGLVYGFGAYRFSYLYLGHLNFNSNEWLPYYVLFLRRIFGESGAFATPLRPSPRNGFFAGLFFVLTGWTESTFAAFLALLSAFYLLFQLGLQQRRLFRRNLIINLSELGIVALVGLSPLIWAVGSDLMRYGNFLVAGSGGAEFLSADLLSFLVPSEHNPILGFLSRDLAFHNMDFAFVGYVTLVLALIGLAAWRRRAEFAFWGIAALLCAWIMLGPVLHVGNQALPDFSLLPFRLLQSVPLLSANRLPIRYDHLLMLALAILAGGGASILFGHLKSRALLILLLPALVLIEHLGAPLSMSDLTVPAVYHTIAAEPGDFSILDLPVSWSSSTFVQGRLYTQSQFYQTVHHKRLLGGNTSRPPAYKFQYFNELPIVHSLILLENGEAPDENTLAEDVQAAPEFVRFFDLRYIVARPDQTDAPLLDYARRVFRLTPVSDDRVLAFRVAPAPSRDLTIDHASAISRLYFGDDWGRAQTAPDGTAFRWATVPQAELLAPLTPSDYQMCGLYAGARDGQRVQIRVNELTVGTLTLAAPWVRQCVQIPARALHEGLNSIVFESDPVALRDATLAQDRHIGQTGAIAPVDISVTSGGFRAGKFASLAADGNETYVTKRGVYLMTVDENGRAGAAERFDTFDDEKESARLAEFVQDLPKGMIVAGAVCDEASRHFTLQALEALRTLGVEVDRNSQFRTSYAFIGVKGAPPGTALQDSAPTFPANVSVGKNITTPHVTFALGPLQFSALVK